MILDSLLEFGDAFSVALAATTANMTNQIDTGAVVRDLGAGEPIYAVVTVDTNITVATTAGTIQYRLVSDDTASISTTTCTVHATSPAFATSSTATAATKTLAGSRAWVVALPSGIAYERYLGMQVIVGTNTIATGKVNAFLTKNPSMHGIYPDALS